MNESLCFTTHDSALGKLLIVAGQRGIRLVSLLAEGEDAMLHMKHLGSISPKPCLLELDGFFKSALQSIDRYLAGQERQLNIPVEITTGTALQRAVWLAIAKIPYGQTISYTTLAERVGFPRAVRAVASACGANPVPLIIPCHRVVAKDGTHGGFSLGGPEVKEKLLKLEQPRDEKTLNVA